MSAPSRVQGTCTSAAAGANQTPDVCLRPRQGAEFAPRRTRHQTRRWAPCFHLKLTMSGSLQGVRLYSPVLSQQANVEQGVLRLQSLLLQDHRCCHRRRQRCPTEHQGVYFAELLRAYVDRVGAAMFEACSALVVSNYPSHTCGKSGNMT